MLKPAEVACFSCETSCVASQGKHVRESKGRRAFGVESKDGKGPMRVMTDVSAERYWTVVSEMEVPSLEEFTEGSRKSMEHSEFQTAMKTCHDLLDHGRREICVIEK